MPADGLAILVHKTYLELKAKPVEENSSFQLKNSDY